MGLFTRITNAWNLYRFASRDARTPAASRFLPWLSLIYLISPIDFIPDVLPLLGQLDDIGIIILLCTIALRMIPHGVKQDFRRNVIDVEPKR